MNQSLASVGLFSDHLEAFLARPEHRDNLNRQVRISIVGTVIGLAGLVLSTVLLLTARLAPPADAFWLLCLVLSAGIFGVAQFTLVGSLLSHVALQRFAVGRKDLEVFEAVQDYECLRDSILALAELAEGQVRARKRVDSVLMVDTVAFISAAAEVMGEDLTGSRREQVVMGWKAKGADDDLLARLTMQSSVGI